MVLILSLFAAVSASGCQLWKGAASPEEAVLQQASRSMGPQVKILTETIQLRQTQSFIDLTFLLLSYDRIYENRREPCLVMYEVYQNPTGTWATATGNVFCQVESDASVPGHPLDVNGALEKSPGPGTAGMSYATGLVHREEIKKILVTWSDGNSQIVDVIEGTYLAFNASAFPFNSVQGLGANDEVLYTIPVTPPGK